MSVAQQTNRASLAALACVLLLAGRVTAYARDPQESQHKLSDSEDRAVQNCLRIIRGCQFDDGYFVQANLGTTQSAPLWIVPYFTHYAALALLADCEYEQDSELAITDLARVGRWLSWCASHQEDEGNWVEYGGTVGNPEKLKKTAAWDNSLALFLVVLERYRRAGGELTPELANAGKRAFQCLQSLRDKDGLTWAAPKWKIKYFLDNCEVNAGMTMAATLFDSLDDHDAAIVAREHAALLSQSLPEFFRERDNAFAWAKHASGNFDGGILGDYPHGVAQLFGLTFVARESDLWESMKRRLKEGDLTVQNSVHAVTGAERWAAAASRFGKDDSRQWRERLVADAQKFSTTNVYVFRPGVAVLVLLEGADWMPSILSSKR